DRRGAARESGDPPAPGRGDVPPRGGAGVPSRAGGAGDVCPGTARRPASQAGRVQARGEGRRAGRDGAVRGGLSVRIGRLSGGSGLAVGIGGGRGGVLGTGSRPTTTY